jgi:hypothetical protein
MIRFSHTVFALPYAFMGAVLAAGGIPSGDTPFLPHDEMLSACTQGRNAPKEERR